MMRNWIPIKEYDRDLAIAANTKVRLRHRRNLTDLNESLGRTDPVRPETIFVTHESKMDLVLVRPIPASSSMAWTHLAPNVRVSTLPCPAKVGLRPIKGLRMWQRRQHYRAAGATWPVGRPALKFGLCLAFALLAYDSTAAQELPRERPSALPWLKIEELSNTRDRPLLAPDRRKEALPAPTIDLTATSSAPPAPEIPFVLTGVIVEQTRTTILLRDVARSQTVVVRPDVPLGSWRLLESTAKSASLSDGEKVLNLEMFAKP